MSTPNFMYLLVSLFPGKIVVKNFPIFSIDKKLSLWYNGKFRPGAQARAAQ